MQVQAQLLQASLLLQPPLLIVVREGTAPIKSHCQAGVQAYAQVNEQAFSHDQCERSQLDESKVQC